MHWRAEAFGSGRDERGVRESARVDADFVGTCLEHCAHVFDGADAAADGERHEALGGCAFDDVDHGGASVS